MESPKLFSLPCRERMRIFMTWGLAALVGFPIVYGFTNYLGSLSERRYSLYFPWETNTPFVPQWIWVYLSLNLVIFLPLFMVDSHRLRRYCQANLATLLIGAAFFLLFPTQLGFERLIPDFDPYKSLFEGMVAIDKPHNLVPSLHVTFSALSLICVAEAHRERMWLVVLSAAWIVSIALSIVFVRQHHFTDAWTGLLLAFLGMRFVYFRPQKTTK